MDVAMMTEAVAARDDGVGGEKMMAAAAAVAGLNPDAEEFMPWWRLPGGGGEEKKHQLSADAPEFVSVRGKVVLLPGAGNALATGHWRRKVSNNYSQQGRARTSSRVRRAQQAEFVRRTVYVTDIDHTVTEDMLAALFWSCGTVVDCRICGDPTTGLRFAFIELEDEDNAYAALHLDGIVIGIRPLRVSPSRTAIMPVNPAFLPQTELEKEMCSRTVYCTNIEKSVTQSELRIFCQEYFGQVSRIRLLGDDYHATHIAFIEFVEASGAINALNSTGIFARGLPIRVSPSKTPIKSHSSPSAIPESPEHHREN